MAAALVVASCGTGHGPESTSPTATLTPATAQPTSTPIETPALPLGLVLKVATTDLNVRTGPSLDRYIVGRLQPDDQVSVLGKSKDGEWLALAGLGWAYYTPGWFAPDPDLGTLDILAATAVAPPTYPPGTSTGFPAIDEVVVAVVSGDATGLSDLAVSGLQQRGCSEQWSAVADPTGSFTKFLAIGGATELRLYAMFAEPTNASDAAFVVVFGSSSGAGAALWLNKAGRISRIDTGCSSNAGDFLPPAGEGQPLFYLRPEAPSPLHSAH